MLMLSPLSALFDQPVNNNFGLLFIRFKLVWTWGILISGFNTHQKYVEFHHLKLNRRCSKHQLLNKNDWAFGAHVPRLSHYQHQTGFYHSYLLELCIVYLYLTRKSHWDQSQVHTADAIHKRKVKRFMKHMAGQEIHQHPLKSFMGLRCRLSMIVGFNI